MKATYLTESPGQTKKMAGILAKEILKTTPGNSKAFILALEGNLGTGKTTFLQGFAKGLGIRDRILSPTFVLMKKFKIKNDSLTTNKIKYFIHFDCYRIEKPKEILDLGFKENRRRFQKSCGD